MKEIAVSVVGLGGGSTTLWQVEEVSSSFKTVFYSP